MSKRLFVFTGQDQPPASIRPNITESLPLEIVTHILKFLTAKEWLPLRLVSKSMLHIIDASGVLRSISIVLTKSKIQKDERVLQLFRTWGITSVDISCLELNITKVQRAKDLQCLVQNLQLSEIILTVEDLHLLGQLKLDGDFSYDVPTVLVKFDLRYSKLDPKKFDILNIRRLCMTIPSTCLIARRGLVDEQLRQLSLGLSLLTHIDITVKRYPDNIPTIYAVYPPVLKHLPAVISNLSATLVYLRIHGIILGDQGPLFPEVPSESGTSQPYALQTLDLSLFGGGKWIGFQLTHYDIFRGVSPSTVANLRHLRLEFHIPVPSVEPVLREIDFSRVGFNVLLGLEKLEIRIVSMRKCSTENTTWMASLPKTLRSFRFEETIMRMSVAAPKRFLAALANGVGRNLTELGLGQSDHLPLRVILQSISAFTALQTLMCSFSSDVFSKDIMTHLAKLKSLKRLCVYRPPLTELDPLIVENMRKQIQLNQCELYPKPPCMFP